MKEEIIDFIFQKKFLKIGLLFLSAYFIYQFGESIGEFLFYITR